MPPSSGWQSPLLHPQRAAESPAGEVGLRAVVEGEDMAVATLREQRPAAGADFGGGLDPA